jgi:hypothetical protein
LPYSPGKESIFALPAEGNITRKIKRIGAQIYSALFFLDERITVSPSLKEREKFGITSLLP